VRYRKAKDTKQFLWLSRRDPLSQKGVLDFRMRYTKSPWRGPGRRSTL
jgi:hypothetical protein